MRVISLLNLKGGVGKTTTAVNMAILLARYYGQRILIVDNDIQANATRYFNLHSYDKNTIESVYREKVVDMEKVICRSPIRGPQKYTLDIVPCNMNMDAALLDLMMDKEQEQISKLKNALSQVEDRYDFCIIDNPPGIGMNVLNALACTNDIIVPVKIDKYSLDGMEELADVAGEMAEFNPHMESMRCLVTMFYKSPEMIGGDMVLRKSAYDVFDTRIRYSRKVDSGSFEKGCGLCSYSPRSAASIDYKVFVKEYIRRLPEKQREGVVFHA